MNKYTHTIITSKSISERQNELQKLLEDEWEIISFVYVGNGYTEYVLRKLLTN